MNIAELGNARRSFRFRLDSLANGVRRCFWEIRDTDAPGPAFFPAVMYCFATLDYFSSHWYGENQSAGHRTERFVGFLEKYLLYGCKESILAIHFWRHKLMHTSEPRELRDRDSGDVYDWRTGRGLKHHMDLVLLGDNRYLLEFDPLVFINDLQEAIFGPSGYFEDLRHSEDLQAKYEACVSEMASYSISLKHCKIE